jgi:hypothetical protein
MPRGSGSRRYRPLPRLRYLRHVKGLWPRPLNRGAIITTRHDHKVANHVHARCGM